MTKIKYLLPLLFFMTGVFGEIDLFKVKSVQLRLQKYPWLDELHLQVEGFVRGGLTNSLVTVSLYHENEKLRWFDVLTKKNKGRLMFSGKWDGLNKGVQEVHPGIYTVKVELTLEKQSPKTFRRLQQKFKGKKINSYQKSFTIGSKKQRIRQEKQNQKFYLDRIKSLHRIFEEMIAKRNGVLRHIFNVNEDKVTIAQWRNWFNRFSKRLQKEKDILEKREKQFLSLHYETTHNNLKLYCKFLKELTIAYTRSFYRYRSERKRQRQARYISPYTQRQFVTHLRYIRQLHIESQDEMAISLDEKLGFTPPQPSGN